MSFHDLCYFPWRSRPGKWSQALITVPDQTQLNCLSSESDQALWSQPATHLNSTGPVVRHRLGLATRHRSVSVSRHFLLQAPQCPCSMRKRFSRDHCCWGRSKPGYRIKYILPNYQKKASGKDSSIINDCYNGLIPQTNMLLALI